MVYSDNDAVLKDQIYLWRWDFFDFFFFSFFLFLCRTSSSEEDPEFELEDRLLLLWDFFLFFDLSDDLDVEEAGGVTVFVAATSIAVVPSCKNIRKCFTPSNNDKWSLGKIWIRLTSDISAPAFPSRDDPGMKSLLIPKASFARSFFCSWATENSWLSFTLQTK